jgi:acetyl-CoA carboxylase carboxyltransferase component
VIANDPLHLGGAIDAAAAEKAPRFMQLCDAHDLPILSLCDTPGFMVGPDVETEAQVRHCSGLFVTAANIGVPMFTIVLRKDYGLGAQAATGASARPCCRQLADRQVRRDGPRGYVRLAFRRELEAIEDPRDRHADSSGWSPSATSEARRLSMAEHFELDDMIDPRGLARLAHARPQIAAAPPAPRRRQAAPERGCLVVNSHVEHCGSWSS